MKIIITLLVIWNILLTLVIVKMMTVPDFSYYYLSFDRDGIWLWKTWVGARGGGVGSRLIKWFWVDRRN